MMLLWSWLLACALVAATTAEPVAEFVASKKKRDDDALWVLRSSDGDVLFGVDEEGGACDDTPEKKSLAIVGFVRPNTIARFCLDATGSATSNMTRRRHRATDVERAPTLRELASVATDDPSKCLPSGERGLFFETIELLCFALGLKPAVVRQLQASQGAAATSAALLGVPANLFVPHSRQTLRWLLRQPVWRGLSKNHWSDLAFEHSIVLARTPELGVYLVSLNVQDASVPAQPTNSLKAEYIAVVGQALGYPHADVRDYLATVMPPGFPIDDALSRCPRAPPRQYPELPGFRDFLDGAGLSKHALFALVEPLDDLFDEVFSS